MIYQDPKIDWKRTDGVTNDDLNRIEGNVKYLHGESTNHDKTIGKMQKDIDNLQVSGIPKLQSYIYDLEATTDNQKVFEIPYKYLDVATDTVIVYINGFAVPDNYYKITPPVESEGVITSGHITLAFAKPTGTIVKVAIFKNVPVGEEGAVSGNILTLNSVPLDRLIGYAPASNPNLLINGDFQVWQRGTSFNVIKNGVYNYTADRWIVQTDSDNIVVSSLGDSGMRVDMRKFNGSYTNVIQLLELPLYKRLVGKTVTIKVKFKNKVSNIAIGLRALPDASATHTLINETSSEFTITAPIPTCSVECTKFMLYIQSKTPQLLDFDYIKLELGDVTTPFCPRAYNEELEVCQAYYQTDFLGRVQLRSRNDTPDIPSLLGFISYIKAMRIRPTLRLRADANLDKCIVGASFGFVTPTKFNYYSESNTTGAHIGFTLTEGVGTANVYFGLRRNILEADAEIY